MSENQHRRVATGLDDDATVAVEILVPFECNRFADGRGECLGGGACA